MIGSFEFVTRLGHGGLTGNRKWDKEKICTVYGAKVRSRIELVGLGKRNRHWVWGKALFRTWVLHSAPARCRCRVHLQGIPDSQRMVSWGDSASLRNLPYNYLRKPNT